MTPDQIRAFLLALQDCWRAGNPTELAAFYHPDVVLVPPDLGAPIRGRDAVVASYQEFLDVAQLEKFAVTSLEIFPFSQGSNTVHMAHLEFEISYQLDDENYLEKGLELYAVLEHNEVLQIVWRNQIVLDSRLAEKSDST